jgi:hypothetical protein
LQNLDEDVYTFRLTCDEAEMERRVRGRSRGIAQGEADLAWELHRFRELSAIQDAAAQRGNLGFVIDTTYLDPRQVAQAIWGKISGGEI